MPPFLSRISDSDVAMIHRWLETCRREHVEVARMPHAGLEVKDLEFLDGLRTDLAVRLVGAVQAERRAWYRSRVELVWTGPEAGLRPTRSTAAVVPELFSKAEAQVLVCGYAFDHGRQILSPLHRAMVERGVEACLFLNVKRPKDGQDSRKHLQTEIEKFWRYNWPFGDPRPKIFYDPRTPAEGSEASLHAKCVVVDRRWSLVGSANFTDRGFTRNVEVGALIEDRSFSQRLSEQWMGLVDRRIMVSA